MEMRHMLENMMELSEADKPNSARALSEQKDHMMMLRRMMDRLVHLDEW